MTFSRAFSDGKSWIFWKARARPSSAPRYGGQPVRSVPAKATRPPVGRRMPEMMLNRVVLPAPLGPMIEVTDPGFTSKLTPESAWSPPKRWLTLSATSTGAGLARQGGGRSPPHGSAHGGAGMRGLSAPFHKYGLVFSFVGVEAGIEAR